MFTNRFVRVLVRRPLLVHGGLRYAQPIEVAPAGRRAEAVVLCEECGEPFRIAAPLGVGRPLCERCAAEVCTSCA